MNDDSDDEFREWVAARRADRAALQSKLAARDEKLAVMDAKLDKILALVSRRND